MAYRYFRLCIFALLVFGIPYECSAKDSDTTLEDIIINCGDAKTGSFQTRFTERNPMTNYGNIVKRLKIELKRGVRYSTHYYTLEKESFEVYVPKNNDSNKSYGAIVHISPSDSGRLPCEEIKPVLDKFNLIWIGANNSGNRKDVYYRRIPLALDAVFNIQKFYNIDPKRIYVTGVSGGGRVASSVAFHYSDIFSGGIFIIGANHWAKLEVPKKPGHFWPKGFHRPEYEYMKLAKDRGRYVLLTGERDMNRDQMRAIYDKGYKKYLKHSLYLEVNNMGHQNPPVEWYEKAIQFVENPKVDVLN